MNSAKRFFLLFAVCTFSMASGIDLTEKDKSILGPELVGILEQSEKDARNIEIPFTNLHKCIGLKSGFHFFDFCKKKGILDPKGYNKVRFLQLPFIKASVIKFSFLRISEFSKQEFYAYRNSMPVKIKKV